MLRSQHNASGKEDEKIRELGDEEKEEHTIPTAAVPKNSLSHFLYAHNGTKPRLEAIKVKINKWDSSN